MVYTQSNFEKIYKLYYPKMSAFARNYISANEDVENIVQDVFLVLWEKKDELEQVYLLEEGVEQKVLYKEKEVTLNRLKLARRDGIGTKR